MVNSAFVDWMPLGVTWKEGLLTLIAVTSLIVAWSNYTLRVKLSKPRLRLSAELVDGSQDGETPPRLTIAVVNIGAVPVTIHRIGLLTRRARNVIAPKWDHLGTAFPARLQQGERAIAHFSDDDLRANSDMSDVKYAVAETATGSQRRIHNRAIKRWTRLARVCRG